MCKDRCPWCGKIIKRHYDQRFVKKEKTPTNLRFSRCSYCNNYYGQNVNSNRWCFLVICLLLVLGILTKCFYISFSSILLILFVLFAPIVKMDEEENEVICNSLKIKMEIVSKSSKIKLHKLYFLDNEFDKYDCFSIVSPIYIHSFDKKTKKFLVSFIYENKQNAEYINISYVDLYNSNMKKVAKVNFTT